MSHEQTKKANKSVARGVWGEDVALNFLKRKGWRLVGRRVRPCARDRRGVAFVEVKTHRARSPRATRLWCVNKRKKSVLLRACSCWIMHERWHGNFRFDVVQVYGEPEGAHPPEIDHIENVPLFPPKWRFW